MILALLSAAHAFCGAYVGDGSSTLTNRASQIVMARDGDATTLTMFNDYTGSLSSFGLVIPVPAGLNEDNVRVVSRDLLTKISEYSAPRLVAYTCDDLYGISDAAQAADTGFGSSGSSMSFGCSGGNNYEASMKDSSSPAALDSTGVIIEEQFDLAEYTVFVLSADGGGGLSAWLSNNGFAVSEDSLALFDEYIDSGSQFLALKVDISDVIPGQFLSPLQLHYPTQGWSLPIRMGAQNSAGVQDLVVYMLSPVEEGTVGVSNYSENPGPESECLLEVPANQTFGEWYEQRLSDAVGLPDTPEELSGQSGLSWFTEYSWVSGACDPCTSMGPLSDIEVNELGYLNTHLGWQFTRLHFRYTPDAVTQDLVFYGTRQGVNSQRRYVQHAWELESSFPVCGDVQPVEPGACYSAEYWARRARGETTEALKTSAGSDGCGSGFAVLLLPVLALGLRRRG